MLGFWVVVVRLLGFWVLGLEFGVLGGLGCVRFGVYRVWGFRCFGFRVKGCRIFGPYGFGDFRGLGFREVRKNSTQSCETGWSTLPDPVESMFVLANTKRQTEHRARKFLDLPGSNCTRSLQGLSIRSATEASFQVNRAIKRLPASWSEPRESDEVWASFAPD